MRVVQKYLTVVVLVVVVVVDVEVIVVGSSETIVRDKILSQGMFTTFHQTPWIEQPFSKFLTDP